MLFLLTTALYNPYMFRMWEAYQQLHSKLIALSKCMINQN